MPRYIDADALIDFLDIGHLRHSEYLSFSEVEVANLLLHAPTADVAPVMHGHWELVTDDKYRCSVCGVETRVDECFGEPMYKGCPYCLAIMDGKDGKADGTI